VHRGLYSRSQRCPSRPDHICSHKRAARPCGNPQRNAALRSASRAGLDQRFRACGRLIGTRIQLDRRPFSSARPGHAPGCRAGRSRSTKSTDPDETNRGGGRCHRFWSRAYRLGNPRLHPAPSSPPKTSTPIFFDSEMELVQCRPSPCAFYRSVSAKSWCWRVIGACERHVVIASNLFLQIECPSSEDGGDGREGCASRPALAFSRFSTIGSR
jgi:hypothetical protein